MRHIYIDYAATTPVDKRVMKVANSHFSKNFGNPSSSHTLGFEAREDVSIARKKASMFFNCSPDEVIFTSGGTESENLAIKGISFSNKKNGKHIIISSVEHASVDSSANFLEKQGFEITRIPVDKNCTVDTEKLFSAVRADTTLISIMYVNNEIGTIQPIISISKELKEINSKRIKEGLHEVKLHVDGEAGSIYLDYDVSILGVNSISVNGSKVYSLKGASALYVKKGTSVATQICGGGQEFLYRGGTENVPALVALGEALTVVKNDRSVNAKKIFELKERLTYALKSGIPNVRINTPKQSVPNILHVTFLNYPKIDLISELNKYGIFASSGSACAANKKEEKSRVLQAMGFSEDEIDMSIRFSLGKFNKKADIVYIIKVLKIILHL